MFYNEVSVDEKIFKKDIFVPYVPASLFRISKKKEIINCFH